MSSRKAGILLILAAIVLTYLVTTFALAASPATQPQPRVSFTDRYGVIADRNIFLKERSSRRPSDRGSSTQPAPRPVEESFTLVGIVHEEGQWRAYVEDRGRSATTRLAAGDAVARGKVTRIEIDGIEYDPGEKPTWISIGSDLTGRALTLGGISGLDMPTAATGPTTLPFDPNDPNLTIEQRMRLRRLQGR